MVQPPTPPENRLVHADALAFARGLPPGSVDLAYLDPPFFTGRTLKGRGVQAFADHWDGDIDAYLAWLEPLLAALRESLTPTGSIYVHLDWHAVHYAKVLMDRIFGYDSFLNEVVWLYGLGGSSNRRWPRKHDNLLWYARDPGRHWFEAARIPATSQRMRGQMKKAPDWWEIPALNNMAHERTGYPTQKPLALLDRIVRSSCPPRGLVVDPCCGSGTTAVAAHAAGRSFVVGDCAEEAVTVTRTRLDGLEIPFVETLHGERAELS
ncbi:MAG: site-specific DNA-methyltransferase [Planctomycetota bacterium]|nr:site-specific DNA-methyltransferase [Planctomycetota bacterium]